MWDGARDRFQSAENDLRHFEENFRQTTPVASESTAPITRINPGASEYMRIGRAVSDIPGGYDAFYPPANAQAVDGGYDGVRPGDLGDGGSGSSEFIRDAAMLEADNGNVDGPMGSRRSAVVLTYANTEIVRPTNYGTAADLTRAPQPLQ